MKDEGEIQMEVALSRARAVCVKRLEVCGYCLPATVFEGEGGFLSGFIRYKWG